MSDQKTTYDNTKQLKQEYLRGVIEGITMFAWWKDGVQYVGTCGTTLKEALKEVQREQI